MNKESNRKRHHHEAIRVESFFMIKGEPDIKTETVYSEKLQKDVEIKVPYYKNGIQVNEENWEQYKHQLLEEKLNLNHKALKHRTRKRKLEILRDRLLPKTDLWELSEMIKDFNQLIEEELAKVENNTPAEEIQTRITAKHYVLTFLLECHATGKPIPLENEKKRLEAMGKKRFSKISGNTFYKNYRDVKQKDLNSEKELADIAGEKWREIIIELTNEPEALEKYLQSKQL